GAIMGGIAVDNTNLVFFGGKPLEYERPELRNKVISNLVVGNVKKNVHGGSLLANHHFFLRDLGRIHAPRARTQVRYRSVPGAVLLSSNIRLPTTFESLVPAGGFGFGTQLSLRGPNDWWL